MRLSAIVEIAATTISAATIQWRSYQRPGTTGAMATIEAIEAIIWKSPRVFSFEVQTDIYDDVTQNQQFFVYFI